MDDGVSGVAVLLDSVLVVQLELSSRRLGRHYCVRGDILEEKSLREKNMLEKGTC